MNKLIIRIQTGTIFFKKLYYPQGFKQETHGPHHSPEKRVQINNTNYYIIMLIKRRKNPLYTLWEFNGSSFEQICIPLIQGCIAPSSIEISPAVLEKKIFKFCQCIFTISLLFPIEKRWGPSFEQIWILITQGCIVPSLVEISPAVLEKKIFKLCQCIFTISLLSPI